MLAGRADRASRIPFGPFLLAGTLAAVLLGSHASPAKADPSKRGRRSSTSLTQRGAPMRRAKSRDRVAGDGDLAGECIPVSCGIPMGVA